MILNPDCELPLVNGKIPNWVETVGQRWTQGSLDLNPQQGKFFFFAGVEPRAELTQTILLDEYSCLIDRNSQTFRFTGYVRSFKQDPIDQSQIIIEMLSGRDALLKSTDLGIYGTWEKWVTVSAVLDAPVQTRKIRIRLVSIRRNGSDNDGYFDNLSLSPEPSAKNIVITSVNSLAAQCGQGTGSLTIAATGGSGALQYSLDGTTFQAGNSFSNLTAGVYIVSVKDQLPGGCLVTQTIPVGGSENPRIDQILPTPASCSQPNGVLAIRATGSSGMLQYSLDGATFQVNSSFTNLVGGVYSLSVRDQSTRCTVVQSVTLASSTSPRIEQIQPISTDCGQANGGLSVTATGGSGVLEYSMDGLTFQSSSSFTDLRQGTYAIAVKDGLNCIVSKQITINTGGGGCLVYAPDSFSPNNDGLNDSFRFFCDQNLEVRQSMIFDRFGEVIFVKKNFFIHDPDAVWWDGMYKGQDALAGIYAYQLDYIDSIGNVKVLQGRVVLIR